MALVLNSIFVVMMNSVNVGLSCRVLWKVGRDKGRVILTESQN